jgi:hypothetical protein
MSFTYEQAFHMYERGCFLKEEKTDLKVGSLFGLPAFHMYERGCCNFFSGSPPAENSGVKRAWPGAISGWVTDRKVFPGAQSEDKSAQKRLGLVCRARL